MSGPGDLGNGGLGGGQMPAGFDMSSMADMLNDPSIKEMAAKIASDPAFANMQAMMGGAPPAIEGAEAGAGGGGAALGGMPGMAGMMGAGAGGMDPSAYASMMSNVVNNPGFMKMAETLGQQLMSNPQMSQAMESMQNPDYQAAMKEKMEALKDDPELKGMIEDIENGGPGAMMKYWNDPEALAKLGGAMGAGAGGINMPMGAIGGALAAGSGRSGAPAGADAPSSSSSKPWAPGDKAEPDDEEGEDDLSLHGCASAGDHEGLAEVLAEAGVDPNERDDEGRTALHFCAGYEELECVRLLLGKGAAVDATDRNDNTALHYAAGYGREKAVRELVEAGASCTQRNKDGKTPVDVAKLNKHDAVVTIMEASSFL